MESKKPLNGFSTLDTPVLPRTEQGSNLKLHLGCGKRCLPGFVHVDRADFAHIDYRCGVDRLAMFEDNVANLIYSSHVLEYFDRVEVRLVLIEWNRILCPGGILRLAVPDFRALSEIYSETHNLNLILGPLYGRMEVNGETIYHKTTYDFGSIRQLLEECGFHDVHRYDWRKTIHATVDDHSQAYIPHMDKDHGKLVSLNIECIKL